MASFELSSIRANVLGYARDTYLGSSPVTLNPRVEPIDCSTGYSQWGISERAMAAHRSFDPTSLASYPELTYDALLKPAVLARFAGAGLNEQAIFFGHGSFNLAERLIHKFVEPRSMVGPGPQFNEIPSEFVAAGGTYIPIPLAGPDYEFPLAEIEAALKQGVSLLYLDNPNNPLGRVVSLEIIERLAALSQKEGTIIMVDEAYGDFIADNMSAMELVAKFNNMVVLRSFSKALGLAGARVGYMALSAELAERYRPLDVPFEPSLYSATLAQATLEDREFIERVRTRVLEAKSRIMTVLRAVGMQILPTAPGVSIMALHKPHANLSAALASIGVSIEPGSAFRKTHPAWDDSYCRLRIPPQHQVDTLIERIPLIWEANS